MREDLSIVRNPGSTEAGLGLRTRVDVHVMNAAVVGRGSSSRGARGCLTPRLRSRSISESFSLEEVLSNGPRVEICVQKQLVCDVECGLCF